jgi:hypothetical protein
MESGDRTYPIWLLVNPKYPAIRHYIWTPILVEIQDRIYRELQTNIDTTDIYIRYAVTDKRTTSGTFNQQGIGVTAEVDIFRELINEHKPKIIISFGSLAFEFLRRVYEIKPRKAIKYWCALNLGHEFEKSIANFDINKVNTIPLLRRLIESGNFIDGHNYFRWEDNVLENENYFHYVGTRIAEKLIENRDSFNIWG